MDEESDSDEFDRSDDDDVAGLKLFAKNTTDNYFVGSVLNKVGKSHLIDVIDENDKQDPNIDLVQAQDISF